MLWLSTWMIDNANHLRPNRDGLKVGGHQASSASVATLMMLHFDVLRPQDRVAVKPHASPIFHAIQDLLGRQTRDKLERFRGFGGAQSYPSRTKDGETVDFSTGSVGLGVGMTLFASIAQKYLRLKHLMPTDDPPGRMIALAGDAELDEGNIFEALLEGWKHDVRNLWWVIRLQPPEPRRGGLRSAVRPHRRPVRDDGLARRHLRRHLMQLPGMYNQERIGTGHLPPNTLHALSWFAAPCDARYRSHNRHSRLCPADRGRPIRGAQFHRIGRLRHPAFRRARRNGRLRRSR